MRKGGRLFLLCLLITVVLTGCAAREPQTDDVLVQQPSVAPQQQVLLQAVTEYLGENIVLKYPMGSKTSTPFLWWDADGDGTDELIVLYQNTAKSKNVQLAVMRRGADGWYAAHMDVEGAAGDVDVLRCADLGDGRECLLAGYQDSTGQGWTVCLYRWESGALREYARQYCQQYTLVGLEDGLRLAMVQRNETYGALQLRIYRMADGSAQDKPGDLGDPLITVLDPRFEKCLFLEACPTPTGEQSLVMDFLDDSGNCLAEVMLWAEGHFVRCYTSVGGNIPNFTTRPFTDLPPADLDDDGVLEVPRVESPILIGGSGIRFYQVAWYHVTVSETEPVAYGLVDTKAGFVLLMPSEWQGRQVQMQAAPEGTWILRSIETGEPLFSLRLTEAITVDGFRFLGDLERQRLYLQPGESLSEAEKAVLLEGFHIMYR